jgi:hypothetical protein
MRQPKPNSIKNKKPQTSVATPILQVFSYYFAEKKRFFFDNNFFLLYICVKTERTFFFRQLQRLFKQLKNNMVMY